MSQQVAELLSKTRLASEAKAAAAKQDYFALVRRAAGGDSLEPRAVVAQLDQYGKDVTAFEHDVSTLIARMGMKAEADQLPERRKRLASVQSQTAAARREYEAAVSNAEAKLIETLTPLGTAEQELTAAIAKAESAAAKLVECPYPEIVAARDSAQARLSTARKNLDFIASKIQSERAAILPAATKELEDEKAMASMVGQSLSEPSAKAFQEQEKANRVAAAAARLELTRSIIAEDEAKLPGLQAEVAAAESALSEAQAALSNP